MAPGLASGDGGRGPGGGPGRALVRRAAGGRAAGRWLGEWRAWRRLAGRERGELSSAGRGWDGGPPQEGAGEAGGRSNAEHRLEILCLQQSLGSFCQGVGAEARADEERGRAAGWPGLPNGGGWQDRDGATAEEGSGW